MSVWSMYKLLGIKPVQGQFVNPATATLWAITLLEWTAKISPWPRIPGAFALAAAAGTALCVWKFFKIRRLVRHDRQDRDGEREVAEILDALKQVDAHVLHDIPGEEGNVDPVVVSTCGIFVIETKLQQVRQSLRNAFRRREDSHSDPESRRGANRSSPLNFCATTWPLIL